MKSVKIITFVLTVGLFVAACSQTDKPTDSTQNGDSATPQSAATENTPEIQDEIAQGKKHYTEQCVKCHKETGKGGPVEIEGRQLKPEDLTSEKMIKEPDEEYIEYITEGVKDEGMPSFKKILTEEQIKQVVKYIRVELQK